MENINIEEIMAQIKRDIREKGLTPDMLSFEDVPYSKPVQVTREGNATLSDADEALAHMNAHYYIQPYKPLAGSSIKVFIKKVLRKLMKFYVEPVVFEQNEFNANTVSVLNTFRGSISSQPQAQDNSELENRIETLELAQKELLNRLSALERENTALREALGKQDEA
ncbi:MAG: hypothetical protein IJM38_03630 [Ruminococcus sp.]|nr:hypothetical protein [Ruminococcus sp.]